MNNNTIKLERLLNEVSAISKKYEKVAELTGENFNIFNVLKLSTREVRTHSAFLAELLNPNGSHGQGIVFLELFIEQLKENRIIKNKKESIIAFGLTTKKTRVIVEENIGKIIEDEGGRIDIVIKDENYQIVIENKIYAKDQYKQLVRYHEEYPNALLLYLTLEGADATEASLKKSNGKILEVDKDYYKISYKEDILNWLKKSKEKAVNQPLLRETIAQYINLIKQLTGQAMNEIEKEEIAKMIIKSESNVKASFNIAESIIPKVKELIFSEIIKEDVRQLGFNTEMFAINGTEAFFILKNEYKLTLSFRKHADYFVVGIKYPHVRNIDNYEVQLKEKFDKLGFDNIESWDNYGFIHRPVEYSRWNIKQPWLDVKNGKFKMFLEKIVNEFKEVSSNIKKE